MSSIETPAGWAAGTWLVRTDRSRVGFVIRHLAVSKVNGRFTTFEATITTTSDPASSRVDATIDAGSLNTGNRMRDGLIGTADFFDLEHHPSFSFAATGVRGGRARWQLDGDLTIRGTTRPVTLTLEPPIIRGGTMTATATTEIRRGDFGVTYTGPVPGGSQALGEKVQIVLEIEAELQR